MKKFFPYDPTNPVAVEGEAHKIIHGQIRLDHVPLESSIEVRGFRPAQSAANLQSNEFFCSYRADTLYREANRLVYFWAGRSGQTVFVSYQAVASPITADDMNEIGQHLTASEKRLDAQDLTSNEIRNSVINVREEARRALTAHNSSVDAHGDIRNKIDAEGAMRIAADTSLQQQLNVTSNAFNMLSAALQEAIDTVENLTAQVNALSHLPETVTQLQTRLEDEINLRSQLAVTVAELQGQINAETLARINLENTLDDRITFDIDAETFNDFVFGDGNIDIINIFDPKTTDNDALSDEDKAFIFDDESPAGDVTDDEINEIFTD